MRRILFQFVHPTPQRSRANRAILEAVKKGVPDITINDLYSKYPNFDIDIKAEQKLLMEHDDVFFQHPFYWYSMPPLLKLWMDEVLEFEFAYGPKGNFLEGKGFHLSLTVGGAAAAYTPGGQNRFPIESFFPSYDQTAYLCGMKWNPPFVLFHASTVPDEALREHTEKIVEYLRNLRHQHAEAGGLTHG